MHLTEHFYIDTDFFRFSIVRERVPVAQVRREERRATILLPHSFPADSATGGAWLQTAAEQVLRREAGRLIVPLLRQLAADYGFPLRRITVKNMHTRWGSCSSLGNINLSLWLLALPERFITYVLKHELAHLRHLDHSPAFWTEVDAMTGGPGTAKALQRALRDHSRTLFKP